MAREPRYVPGGYDARYYYPEDDSQGASDTGQGTKDEGPRPASAASSGSRRVVLRGRGSTSQEEPPIERVTEAVADPVPPPARTLGIDQGRGDFSAIVAGLGRYFYERREERCTCSISIEVADIDMRHDLRCIVVALGATVGVAGEPTYRHEQSVSIPLEIVQHSREETLRYVSSAITDVLRRSIHERMAASMVQRMESHYSRMGR